EAPMEPFGVNCSVERYCMLRDTGHAEIVADTPDAEYQRTVGNDAGGENRRAIVAETRSKMQLVARAVEAGDGTGPESEVVPVADQEVVERVQIGIHAAPRHLRPERAPPI